VILSERERGKEVECDRGKEREERESERRQLSLGAVPTQSGKNIHKDSTHIVFDWISRQRKESFLIRSQLFAHDRLAKCVMLYHHNNIYTTRVTRTNVYI